MDSVVDKILKDLKDSYDVYSFSPGVLSGDEFHKGELNMLKNVIEYIEKGLYIIVKENEHD